VQPCSANGGHGRTANLGRIDAFTSLVVKPLPLTPQSPLLTLSMTTSVSSWRFSPSIATIAFGSSEKTANKLDVGMGDKGLVDKTVKPI
jgi:hypothetical protein